MQMTASWSPWLEGGDELCGRMLTLRMSNWVQCPVLPFNGSDTFSNVEYNYFLR